jgi:ribonuclease HI
VIVAYTDGACAGNPGPGGWAAVILADGQRQEISGAVAHTTNNRMELTAVIEALRRVPADAAVTVVTDSEYVRRGMTEWVAGWRQRGWRTATGGSVANRDLWEALSALAGDHVTWEWVRGHSGHPENERADALARAHTRGARPAAAGRPATPPASGTTYLSLVEGRLQRHPDWPSCQARTHGRSGARYKKCRGPAEERATVQGWGLPPAALAALDDRDA